jgi:putative DNA primase/helicase
VIDFDETGLYKGFVKNQKGKKFPGRNPQLMSLLEVNNCDSFSGMMNPNVILMDADEEPHNEILQNIIKGENLGCFATDREGGRGVHVLMFNSNTSFKKADKVMLACGIVVDFHPGYSLPYECLKYQGTERKTIYNKQPFQEMPKYFTPLPKCNIDFANMGEGDGRNSTLYGYILSLQNAGFDEDDIKETIRIINQYVLNEPLEEKELNVILRDEAFRKQVFFPKSKFSHDKFAEHIRMQHHVKKINGQLHIYPHNAAFG